MTRTRWCVGIVAAVLVATLAPGVAQADLLTNGDFEDTAADINGAEFTLGTGDLAEWYALNPWSVLPGGPSGSAYYFDHSGGGGGDQRAFQPVAGAGLGSSQVTLTLDYLFERGTWAVQGMSMAVIGFSAGAGSGPYKYVAFGGAGFDGIFGTDDAVRNVLGTRVLAPVATWTSASLTVDVDQDYDVLIVAVASDAWSPVPVSVAGFRGIDNVSLTAPVPEPGTLALTVLGIAGLAAASRRRRRR